MCENYKRPGDTVHQSRSTIKRRRRRANFDPSSSDSPSSSSSFYDDDSSSSIADHEESLPSLAASPQDIPQSPEMLESAVASDAESNHNASGSEHETESSVGSISDESDNVDEPADAASIIEEELRDWALDHNITHSALSDLAKRLRECHSECLHNMHIDARTILNTLKDKVKLSDVAPGHLYQIGIRKHLNFVLSHLSNTVSSLRPLFNIDALSLRESSFNEIWVVSMFFPVIPPLRTSVFPICIYGGPEKPESLESFLRRFVDELIELIANGYAFEDRVVNIHILGFSSDAPAREFIMATKGHGGFSCCSRCWIVGTTYGKKRIYLETDRPLRTDQEFRDRADPAYRPANRSTPLEEIEEIDFGRMFVLDGMHLMFLGTTKYFVLTWLDGERPHKFDVNQRQFFINELRQLKVHIPSVFSRKLQEITIRRKTNKCSLKWKAKEFRLFLLYVGPVILKQYLSSKKYDHFLKLHIAATILFCAKHCGNLELRQYARELLLSFVQSTPHVYEPEFMVTNLHSLIHIVDDADYFSQFFSPSDFSLLYISTWPPENFLGKLKSLARGKARSLQQLGKRLDERSHGKAAEKLYGPSQTPDQSFKSPHENGPLPLFCGNPQYKKAIFPSFTISVLNDSDCYCGLSDGTIVKAENFAFSNEVGEVVLIGKSFTDLHSFYSEPFLDSSYFGIFKGRRLSNRRCWKISLISAQYVALPENDANFILFPLLHCI